LKALNIQVHHTESQVLWEVKVHESFGDQGIDVSVEEPEGCNDTFLWDVWFVRHRLAELRAAEPGATTTTSTGLALVDFTKTYS
jgi:hypothetical protein